MMENTICKACGKEVPNGNFCNQCGSRLPEDEIPEKAGGKRTRFLTNKRNMKKNTRSRRRRQKK